MISIMSSAASFRTENDLLGALEVPAQAYYGIQTLRAVNNFRLSGVPISHYPKLVVGLAMVKQAAADANRELGHLSEAKHAAISEACARLIRGDFHEEFVVDMIQGGAGTSTNMNANEVIANIALEAMGHQKGEYQYLHPNNDVNMAQSTNDVIPTAIRLGAVTELPKLESAFANLIAAFEQKGREFDDVMKSGRTHLQDAMPIRLGQEFTAYAGSLRRSLQRVVEAADYLRDLGIGGSAVGTGVNVEPEYPAIMVRELAKSAGVEVREGKDRIQLMQSMGDAAAFSAQLRVLALDLSKIASDLRLLASGPRTGLDEVILPAVQPGSSIMPGKINPSIPEMVNQVCFQVVGNDTCVSVSAEHGQLELNVMMPVIAHNIFLSMLILTNTATTLADRCVKGIEANAAQCAFWVERSAALATALAPQIGYARAAELSKQSVKENVLIRDLVKREHVIPDDEIDDVLDLRKMTEIGVPGGKHGGVSAG